MSGSEDAVTNGLVNVFISVVGGAVFATVAYIVNRTFMKGYRKDLTRNDLIKYVSNTKTSPHKELDVDEIGHYIREKSEFIPFESRLTFLDDLIQIRTANNQQALENAVDNMINNSINPLL